MNLRRASMNDAAEICAITNAAIRDTVATFTTIERREAGIAADIAMRWDAYQVIELTGHVVGFATYGPFRDGPGYAHTKELTIHLAPQARRQGFGHALMQRLEEVATGQGVHVLVAGISAANPQAQAFHAACGYVETGRLRQVGFKSGQWLDLVLMQKELSEIVSDG